jgi:RNA polymerase sigma-70 factor (ECF subfamily)
MGRLMQDVDADLVRRARHGDEKAFGQLVQRHQRFAFNVACRVLGERSVAEEVTQEAFVRAWRALPGFRGDARFTSWLYRIVHNLSLNRLPSLRRELRMAETPEELLADNGPSPAASLEASEKLEFLHAQLPRLPRKYRLVLTMRYLEEMTYQEIAAELDLPMGTVKTHIHRARRLLTDRLEEWETSGTAAERDREED